METGIAIMGTEMETAITRSRYLRNIIRQVSMTCLIYLSL